MQLAGQAPARRAARCSRHCSAQARHRASAPTALPQQPRRLASPRHRPAAPPCRRSACRPRATGDGREERITDGDLKGLSARVAALRATEVAADARTASNWRSGRVTQRTVTVLSDYVRRLRFVGETLAVGTYGGEVHLIHVPTGRVVRTLAGLRAEVTSLDFDGVSVAAGAIDGAVCRWDAASGDGGELGRHAGEAVTAVALEGAGVVAATAGGLVAAHGCLGGRTLQAAAPVCCLQRAGRYTAAGLADGRVVVWAGTAGDADAADAPLLSRQILAFNAHTAPVLCLQLLTADAGAPDATEAATRLATGGADGVACVWDLAAGGAPLRRLTAHRAPVTCLQADAGKLVSGGRDGAIRVWDLVSGQQRFAIGGHTAYLDALQFEGGRLIASGTNNLVMLHDFAGPDEKA